MSAPLAAARSPAEIAKSSGSSFLTSFLFLSPGRRRALLAVYAFCRVVDDAVDLATKRAADALARGQDDDAHDAARAREDAREQLTYWRNELDAAFAGKPETPTGFALHRAAQSFDLEHQALSEVCTGCEMDLENSSYRDFDGLCSYMRRVASAVGIACLPIFGADRERSRDYAIKLGLALQYTNILRDIAEDASEGRLYLPLDVLERHGVERAWLCSSPPSEALVDGGPVDLMLRAEHEHASSLYVDAADVLPERDRRALRPARIMGQIYHDLLTRVRALGPRVLTAPRCRVPMTRKLYLATFGLARTPR